jgi:secondary thiamine-phosphate synthase enzyme
MIKTINIKTNKVQELVDITSNINDLIKKENIQNGFCIIFVPHTTAAVTINEGADPHVRDDIVHLFAKLVPTNGDYTHMEGNSDAHIKTSIFGSSELIIIRDYRLFLGTWQRVFLFEGDGPRSRKIHIKIIT